MKADLTDAILKILSPLEYLDFHPHKIDGKVSPVNFWKPNSILLRGDNEVRQPGFTAIDYIQDFLLGEAVMIHKPLGVNEISAQRNQAFLKADRQGNSTEGGNFPAFQEVKPRLFASEHVLEI